MRGLRQFEGRVLEVRGYGQGNLLLVAAADISAEPGQFAHLLCGEDSPRTLRRPFSIMECSEGSLRFLVKVVGEGTAWLADRRAGERLDLLAPLGRGFNLQMCERPLLVAGGTGLAPLHFLAIRLREERGHNPRILWGLNCGEDFGEMPAWLEGNMELAIATCDGSAGIQGTALDLLERELARGDYDGIYACGPEAMLAALGPLLEKYSLLCQVSVEQRMACGIGACFGCAVKTSRDETSYLRACADGPVFDYADLAWNSDGQGTG